MKLYSKTFAQKLSNLTSRGSYLAVYGILAPIFFVAGAGLEFTMIHWKPNGINFCELINSVVLNHLHLANLFRFFQLLFSHPFTERQTIHTKRIEQKK